ncbi:MAG: FHA domain-containing protein [Anaerolineae bacterium]|jgi:hypothetical protein|nr:FHA domain-containing protein [Anaerolineae bacterium]
MLVCEKCGKENAEGTSICNFCGHLMLDPKEQASTKKLTADQDEEIRHHWGPARYSSRVHFIVQDTNGADTQLTIDTSNLSEIVVGRRDPKTNIGPTLDLTPYGALDKGVSRHHATIIRKDGALHVVDNNSSNGTYLNNQRLISEQPRVVRHGDEIKFGSLILRVAFEQEHSRP